MDDDFKARAGITGRPTTQAARKEPPENGLRKAADDIPALSPPERRERMRERLAAARAKSSSGTMAPRVEWETLSPKEQRERDAAAEGDDGDDDDIAALSLEERRQRMRERLAQARQQILGPRRGGPGWE